MAGSELNTHRNKDHHSHSSHGGFPRHGASANRAIPWGWPEALRRQQGPPQREGSRQLEGFTQFHSSA